MFNKKIRELKREVRELNEVLDIRKNLSDENANENVKLEREKIELKEKILAKESAFKECEKEVSKLKLKVREQTEADLFFVSSIICAKLLKGKKKEDVRVDEDRKRELLTQLQEQTMRGRGEQQLGMHRPWGGLYGGTFGY